MRCAVCTVGRVTVNTVRGHGRDSDVQRATVKGNLLNDGSKAGALKRTFLDAGRGNSPGRRRMQRPIMRRGGREGAARDPAGPTDQSALPAAVPRSLQQTNMRGQTAANYRSMAGGRRVVGISCLLEIPLRWTESA